jgi:uncharacterized protein YndB with AHSA1/START domain
LPTVRREAVLGGPPQEVWNVLSDPTRLPEWWPGITRVEEASPEAWTTVMTSPRGKVLRSDFTVLESEPPRRTVWRHEVEESPFERIMSDSRLQLVLEQAAAGQTRVELAQRIRLRGFARFGVLQVRRATARTLEGALARLAQVVEDS